MRWISASILVLGALVSAVDVQGGVNLGNGNFYMAYTDVIVRGDPDLEVDRTYNSKADSVGFFGYGWGSEYETFLVPLSDGSVAVYENGSGAVTDYRAPASRSDDRTAAIRRLVAVESRWGRFGTDAERAARFLEFSKDDDLVTSRSLLYSSLLPRFTPQVGRVFLARENEPATVTRTRDGYVRRNASGDAQHFDLKGRLVRTFRPPDATTVIRYDGGGNPSLIRTNDGRWLRFFCTPTGRIERIEASDGKTATYRYDDAENLVLSTDTDGHTYRYEYDRGHNMTAIRYQGGEAMTIAYDERTYFAKEIVHRNGDFEKYDYWSDPQRSLLHYGTKVFKYSSDGVLQSRRECEYVFREDTTLQQFIEESDGDREETTYDASGWPLLLKRGNREYELQYDDSHRVIRRRDPLATATYGYDQDLLTRVVVAGAGLDGAEVRGEVEHDLLDRVARIRFSDGVSLSFAREGDRIVRIDGREGVALVEFRFDAGEGVPPTSVSFPGCGTLTRPDGDHSTEWTADGDVTACFARYLEIQERLHHLFQRLDLREARLVALYSHVCQTCLIDRFFGRDSMHRSAWIRASSGGFERASATLALEPGESLSAALLLALAGRREAAGKQLASLQGSSRRETALARLWGCGFGNDPAALQEYSTGNAWPAALVRHCLGTSSAADALEVARSGDERLEVHTLAGLFAEQSGHPEEARRHYEAGLQAFRSESDHVQWAFHRLRRMKQATADSEKGE